MKKDKDRVRVYVCKKQKKTKKKKKKKKKIRKSKAPQYINWNSKRNSEEFSEGKDWKRVNG
jgi:hypothetical protein